MNQDAAAGKLLLEIMNQLPLEEKHEQIIFNYLAQAYAVGYDHGRHQMRKRKPVAQYDTDGNLIKIWDSATEASQRLKISRNSISEVINGVVRKGRKNPKMTAGGFIWKKVNIKDPNALEEKIGPIQVRSIRQVPKTHVSKIKNPS